MNGTNGSIRVGQSTTFVSRVGSQIVNGVSQSQADTQQLQTGLQVSLTGEVHEATIYSRINISITELLALKKFTALGVDLNLPEVADRELKTQVRCRPGDTILLGGITVSRTQDDYSSGAAIQSRNESTKLTELVVTIRPKLLNFVQNTRVNEPAPVVMPSPEYVPVEPHNTPPVSKELDVTQTAEVLNMEHPSRSPQTTPLAETTEAPPESLASRFERIKLALSRFFQTSSSDESVVARSGD